MNILIVDNYDSFTYNLAQMVALAGGNYPLVVKNDALSEAELDDLSYDAVILSPGPGRPECARDFGICRTLIAREDTPILGVCLGHQGIAHAFGAQVTHAPEPMHGRSSAIHHDGTGLFENIPSPFSAVRYHSLIVENLPNALCANARTEDGLIMAISHRSLPFWGVQFHPESISTEYGERLIANFLKQAGLRRNTTVAVTSCWKAAPKTKQQEFRLKMSVRELPAVAPKDCFERLYRGSEYSFWLDWGSAKIGQGRYSYMGDTSGPHAKVLRYDCNAKELQIQEAGRTEMQTVSLFNYLDEESRHYFIDEHPSYPCPFKGGYVGYFGYELKSECGGTAMFRSSHDDSALMFADRFLAFDETNSRAWLVCLSEEGLQIDAETWFDNMEASLTVPIAEPLGAQNAASNVASWETGPFVPRHSKSTYISLIGETLHKITDGESYEVCLTNHWTSQFAGDPVALYLKLRKTNPAPYAAFISFSDLKILSCSPESFLHISPDGLAETKPMKGTVPRGTTPETDAALAEQLRTSEKDRAENLMIVDLIRNDLNRVCKTGSVQVLKLYGIESFKTVHQMVSTVVGELAEGVSRIDVVKSLFPGGSMTGAPKVRTMEIIDNLEAGARGVYSGVLGYLSVDGALDLSMVIRTLIIDGNQISLGAGGAIVSLSDPVAEYEETLLKMDVLMRTARGKPLA